GPLRLLQARRGAGRGRAATGGAGVGGGGEGSGDMRVAAVPHDIVWEDRDANFERLAPRIAGAVGTGAELVLLTETFSTGFSMTPGIGEPEGGPSAQFLAGRAAEHGVWVGGTCPEIAPGEE